METTLGQAGLLAPTWERYLWPFVTSQISADYGYTPLQTGQENNAKDGRFSCRASFTSTLLSENLSLPLPGTSHNGHRCRSPAAPFFFLNLTPQTTRHLGRQAAVGGGCLRVTPPLRQVAAASCLEQVYRPRLPVGAICALGCRPAADR